MLGTCFASICNQLEGLQAQPLLALGLKLGLLLLPLVTEGCWIAMSLFQLLLDFHFCGLLWMWNCSLSQCCQCCCSASHFGNISISYFA